MKTTPKDTKDPTMTRKEALAVLYKLWAAEDWHMYDARASEEVKALRGSVRTAFSVLRTAIHGEKPPDAVSLCSICYLRYVPTASPFVYLKHDHLGIPSTPQNVCAECIERLKAEGKIERLENWKTGEVIPC